jgi:hypothetical protein
MRLWHTLLYMQLEREVLTYWSLLSKLFRPQKSSEKIPKPRTLTNSSYAIESNVYRER